MGFFSFLDPLRYKTEKIEKDGREMIFKEGSNDYPRELVTNVKKIMSDAFFNNNRIQKIKRIVIYLKRKAIFGSQSRTKNFSRSGGEIDYSMDILYRVFCVNKNPKDLSGNKYFYDTVVEVFLHECAHIMVYNQNQYVQIRKLSLKRLRRKQIKASLLNLLQTKGAKHFLIKFREIWFDVIFHIIHEGIASFAERELNSNPIEVKEVEYIYRKGKSEVTKLKSIIYEIMSQVKDISEIQDFDVVKIYNEIIKLTYDIGLCIISTIMLANPDIELEEVFTMSISNTFQLYYESSRRLGYEPIFSMTGNIGILDYSEIVKTLNEIYNRL